MEGGTFREKTDSEVRAQSSRGCFYNLDISRKIRCSLYKKKKKTEGEAAKTI